MKRIALVLTAAGAMWLVGTNSAMAGPRWHSDLHDELEHRDFHRELDHRRAHRYPMTWWQHEGLHDDLEHEAFHDHLRHRRFHRIYRPRYRRGFGIRTPGFYLWLGR